MVNIYYDKFIDKNRFIRSFGIDINDDELIWHRDKYDRKINILTGSGWKFQFDNELPFEIYPNDQIMIPKMVYHRLIKGLNILKIVIEENKDNNGNI